MIDIVAHFRFLPISWSLTPQQSSSAAFRFAEARASGRRAQHTQWVAARYSTMLPTAAASIGAP
jgi:hypothetical protein